MPNKVPKRPIKSITGEIAVNSDKKRTRQPYATRYELISENVRLRADNANLQRRIEELEIALNRSKEEAAKAAKFYSLKFSELEEMVTKAEGQLTAAVKRMGSITDTSPATTVIGAGSELGFWQKVERDSMPADSHRDWLRFGDGLSELDTSWPFSI